MKTVTCAAIALLVALLPASGSLAQEAMGRSGGPRWGGRAYDPKTVETVSGEVVKVEEIHGKGWGRGRQGRGYGVHVILKSDTEQIAVHMGPNWYLDKQGLKIAAGDRIEVRGSRMTFEGEPAIIAAEVKKGDQSLKLRDDNGLPAWRGQGRQAP